MVAVLFVCLGNICRSPAAEEFLRYLNTQQENEMDLHVESCGIGSWHVGQLPNEQMREAAKERGLVLSSRAQQFKKQFLEEFDYILAVDHDVLNELYQHASTPEQKSKIHLITQYSQSYAQQEIPDPYYAGKVAFDLVLDMLEDSCKGLLNHMKSQV